MAGCARIKADGQRCKGIAMPGAEWCYSHDPARIEERRRNAARGGRAGGRGRRSTAVPEVVALKERLAALADDVLAGEVDRGDAVAVNQILNTLLRAIELERRQAGIVTPEDLTRTMGVVLDIFKRHVPEPERLRALNEDFRALLDEASG